LGRVRVRAYQCSYGFGPQLVEAKCESKRETDLEEAEGRRLRELQECMRQNEDEIKTLKQGHESNLEDFLATHAKQVEDLTSELEGCKAELVQCQSAATLGSEDHQGQLEAAHAQMDQSRAEFQVQLSKVQAALQEGKADSMRQLQLIEAKCESKRETDLEEAEGRRLRELQECEIVHGEEVRNLKQEHEIDLEDFLATHANCQEVLQIELEGCKAELVQCQSAATLGSEDHQGQLEAAHAQMDQSRAELQEHEVLEAKVAELTKARDQSEERAEAYAIQLESQAHELMNLRQQVQYLQPTDYGGFVDLQDDEEGDDQLGDVIDTSRALQVSAGPVDDPDIAHSPEQESNFFAGFQSPF
jgi:hypothetical protein